MHSCYENIWKEMLHTGKSYSCHTFLEHQEISESAIRPKLVPVKSILRLVLKGYFQKGNGQFWPLWFCMEVFATNLSFFEMFSLNTTNLSLEGLEPAAFLCWRPGCYHSTCETHVKDRNFKLTSTHASVIYQIRRIHWISVPFRENSQCSFKIGNNI